MSDYDDKPGKFRDSRVGSAWIIFGCLLLILIGAFFKTRMQSGNQGKGNTQFGQQTQLPGRPNYLIEDIDAIALGRNGATRSEALSLFTPTGPDAITAAVTFEFHPSTEPPGIGQWPLAGYRFYYGPAAGGYTNQIPTQATTVTVGGLIQGAQLNAAVATVDQAGFEGLSGDLPFTVPGGAATATPGPTPLPPTPTPIASPTVAPSPVPTPPPTPTVAPTPTAPPSGGITVSPTVLNFTGIAGGVWPAPQAIQITTSTGAIWNSFDTSTWVDAKPIKGPSGTTTVLKPHTQGMAPGHYQSPITFSSGSLPATVVIMNLDLVAPPTPAPSPGPTAIPTPCVPCPTCPPH